MKIISELELKKMIELEKDKLVVRKDISDETLKRFLSYYDFFTNKVIDLVGKEDKNTILYSKYYWFTKYKKRHFEVYGYDAGIEQEGFKLLEELEKEAEDGIDWVIIQDIEDSEKSKLTVKIYSKKYLISGFKITLQDYYLMIQKQFLQFSFIAMN